MKTIQVSELTDEHLALVCQISSDPGVLKEVKKRWGDEGAEKVNNLVFDYYAKEIGRNVPDYFEVRDSMLYNNNTKKYEGADGDSVIINQHGEAIRGHVKGYTEHQIIPTYEWPTMVVSAQGLHDGTCKIVYIHNTPVYKVKEGGSND